MTLLRAILILILAAVAAGRVGAAEPEAIEIEPLTPGAMVEMDPNTGEATATNGIVVRYGTGTLVARHVTVDKNSGDVVAEGDVRIQRDEMVWIGDRIRYNFRTRQMQAEEFRAGRSPVYLAGAGLQGDLTNHTYSATNAFVTTDDFAQPFQKIRARYVRIVPGKSIEAHGATLYLGSVPVFYFPYYSRKLSERANQFLFTPGYRSMYGPYLLNNYTWFLNEQFDGTLHLDYRVKRGLGGGADANYHLGRWGEGSLSYYYLHDEQPELDPAGFRAPENRQVASFSYQSTPFTNLNVKGVVRYQSDAEVLKEFYEFLYRRNPQPSSFFEVNKSWENFSLDAYVQPRVDRFLETVERLPDVKLTGFRQQLGALPVFYESDSSFGYYHRVFAETNGPVPADFAAARGDTYHQLVLPQTFFDWLNVTPRVGGRFTYYGQSSGAGATTQEQYRGVFNTGVEVSFKASRVWPGVQNRLFDLNGLRHIIQPSVNYVYVPAPNVLPPRLPQFDYEMASLRLLPIDFPDYNAVDSVDSQNVIRLGLQNKLQTKREDGVDNVVNWDLFTDWRIRPRPDQSSFSDIYSAVAFKPRSWLSVESENRFDPSRKRLRLSRETLAVEPNSTWSAGVTYYYLRSDLTPDPTAWGPGSHLVSTTVYYRINENWGLRGSHYYDLEMNRLAEQSYSLYRDLRSWTAAAIIRLRRPVGGAADFTVGFTFSLKAHPRYVLGGDAVERYGLLGY